MRLLLIVYFLCVSCVAQIIQVDSMEKVMDHFKEADRSTLALFDIDMVLTQPEDPAFQMVNIHRYSEGAKEIILSIPAEKRDIFFTLTSLDFEPVLVDDQFPSYLQQLAKKGIPAMALTASLTGSLLETPSLEAWKCDDLRKCGIDFTQTAPHPHPILFCDLPAYRGNHAVYTQGVLLTNGSQVTKGEALVHFLQAAHLSPRCVIFADDKEGNLKSVESALAAHDPSITFIGLHFLGAMHCETPFMSEAAFIGRWEELATQAKSLN